MRGVQCSSSSCTVKVILRFRALQTSDQNGHSNHFSQRLWSPCSYSISLWKKIFNSRRFIVNCVQCMVIALWIIQQWFKVAYCFVTDAQTFMTKSKAAGRLWWLMALFNKKVKENWIFTISDLPQLFPQVLQTVSYETTTQKLGFKTFCARWVPKVLTD